MSKHKANEKWSERFDEPVDEFVKEYTTSIHFDKRLAKVDIMGSLAHAKMLAQQGIIDNQQWQEIEKGLHELLQQVTDETFPWSTDLEDVHMNLEKALTNAIGESGKHVHTGRSRNDQVATDLRLWLRDAVDQIEKALTRLQKSLLIVAEKNVDTIMPGFTHLQVAQPISFAHHLLAYVEMFARDKERLLDCRKRINTMPLGAAALAGTSFPIDREKTAQLLGFERICQNSLDAVSDRDFAIEFTSTASLIMLHLSRFSEELILWMNPCFNFIKIADRFCTGSSIMPQKKNPDVAEMVRGKSGRVIGYLVALLTLMKAQPLAYNKDNQEDKEPLFDTVDTVLQSLTVYADMVMSIRTHVSNMRQAVLQGYATATDLADYLVRKGLPFRDSHGVAAALVKEAEIRHCDLAELPLSLLQAQSKLIDKDVYDVLSPEGSLKIRNHLGGTSPHQVNLQIARWKKILLHMS